MLIRIWASCCTKWSQTQKIAQCSFHTKLYPDRKEPSKLFPALDFTSQYNEETTNRILNVLNEINAEELKRYDVSKARIQKIATYRKSNGPFKTIEQVLEVEDFGAKILEKLVVSIVKGSNTKTIIPDNKVSKKLLNGITSPAVPEAKRRRIDTVTSISIGTEHISWAKIESNGRLSTWNSITGFEWPKKENPVILHDLAVKVRNRLPLSDVYVAEASPKYQAVQTGGEKSMFLKSQKLELTTMLVTLLATEFNQANENDAAHWTRLDNFFFLRRRAAAQLFNLIIGNETVSARGVAQQFIANKIPKSLEHVFPVTIDFLEQSTFDTSDPIKKEALSQVLLLSIAFMDLAVKHNPVSLKAVETSWKY